MNSEPSTNGKVMAQVFPSQKAEESSYHFEVWEDMGSGCRLGVRVSRSYPDERAAQRACNEAIKLYRAEKGL